MTPGTTPPDRPGTPSQTPSRTPPTPLPGGAWEGWPGRPWRTPPPVIQGRPRRPGGYPPPPPPGIASWTPLDPPRDDPPGFSREIMPRAALREPLPGALPWLAQVASREGAPARPLPGGDLGAPGQLPGRASRGRPGITPPEPSRWRGDPPAS